MRVSVLIPTHKRPKLLKRALRSVLVQTHTDLEVVVYGDACGEETKAIIDHFKDNRIRYLSGDSTLGECRARNLLVSEASCEVICWQDDDDVSNINRIERQLEALVSSKASYCRCGAQLLWPSSIFDYKEAPVVQNNPKFVTPTTMTWREIALSIPYREILFGCDTLWELETILKHGAGGAVSSILYYRDMTPPDRVTKTFQERSDYDKIMRHQRSLRDKLTKKISRKCPHWPTINTIGV